MRRLRINFILPATNLSGGVKSNRLIAEAMVRRGHDVRLAYSVGPGAWPPPWRVRRFSRRCRRALRRVPPAPDNHLVRSSAQLLPIASRPVRESDVPDADVTIATWWETREWIEPWSAAKGLKAHFVRHHEVYVSQRERVEAVYRMPGVKLVIARWLQQVMLSEYGDANAVLVPNGVIRTQFDAPGRARPRRRTVGLLYSRPAEKGCRTAFEALRLVQRAMPDVRVVSFGAETVFEDHTPPANFEFTLRPPQHSIAGIYTQCDCWLMPPTTEGLGMPGLEAAACGCPVVATRSGGPEDYVEDGVSGFLIPVDDARAMADRLLQVLKLSDRDWGEMSAASYRVSQRFDWDASAEILERTLLDALVLGHGSPGDPLFAEIDPGACGALAAKAVSAVGLCRGDAMSGSGDRASLVSLETDLGKLVRVRVWSGGKASLLSGAGRQIRKAKKELDARSRARRRGLPVARGARCCRASVAGASDVHVFVEAELGEHVSADAHVLRLVQERRRLDCRVFEERLIDVTAGMISAGLIDSEHSLHRMAVMPDGRLVLEHFQTVRVVRMAKWRSRLLGRMVGSLVASYGRVPGITPGESRSLLDRLASRLSLSAAAVAYTELVIRERLRDVSRAAGTPGERACLSRVPEPTPREAPERVAPRDVEQDAEMSPRCESE